MKFKLIPEIFRFGHQSGLLKRYMRDGYKAVLSQCDISDENFVELCYREFLNRPSDPVGKEHYLEQLKHGLSHLNLIKSLVGSSEYYNILQRNLFDHGKLPNLTADRPMNYHRTRILNSDEKLLTFHVENTSDYDWLEGMITEHGYYEKPGIWSFSIDIDKYIIAEIVSRFNPSYCLELGCSIGAVLKLLNDKHIHAEGIDVSHLALALSYPEIRRKIHFGDILTLNLDSKYDFILGMDIFEHLNPNKLHAYLQRCHQLLSKNGFLFTNIPAFGMDPIFGEVFPLYIDEWISESKNIDYCMFSHLHVDEEGWPINGHLIWATSSWWQVCFKSVGFKREIEIEQALHAVYDDYMDGFARARKSFFVFSKHVDSSIVDHIVSHIRVCRSDYVD